MDLPLHGYYTSATRICKVTLRVKIRKSADSDYPSSGCSRIYFLLTRSENVKCSAAVMAQEIG